MHWQQGVILLALVAVAWVIFYSDSWQRGLLKAKEFTKFSYTSTGFLSRGKNASKTADFGSGTRRRQNESGKGSKVEETLQSIVPRPVGGSRFNNSTLNKTLTAPVGRISTLSAVTTSGKFAKVKNVTPTTHLTTNSKSSTHSPLTFNNTSTSTLGPGQICDIPKLNPYDPAVKHFFKKQPPLTCKKVAPNFFYFRNGAYLWNQTEAAAYKVPTAAVFCRHRCATKAPGDHNAIYSHWVSFPPSAGFTASCDVTQIQCCNSTEFKKLFFVRTYLHVIPVKTNDSNTIAERYNVAMIMFDALSRSNFIRQLPLTYRELKRLGGVDFKRHIKVGDNTEPNLFAFYTGRKPHSKSYPNRKGPYDDWPMLFYYLRDQGYLTYFIEDWDMGSLFVQYGGRGFIKQPSTHYPRPFWLSMWSSKVHKNSSGFCYNDQSYNNLSLSYLLEFFQVYPSSAKFSLTMLERLTHDQFNKGSSVDGQFLDFLTQLKQNLHNTFLFVFSDHGIRYHAIRRTRIGRFESSLPFLSIVMPRMFEKRHPELANNLRANSDVGITSVYDMHYTVKAIADGFKDLAKHEDAIGMSLFGKIPKTRTCVDAGIPNAYCVCEKDMEVALNLTWVPAGAAAIVTKVNKIVGKYPKCAKMTLKNITMVSIKTSTSDIGDLPAPGVHFTSAVLSIVVSPSDAILEADVVYDSKSKAFSVDGSVARINKYGDQPKCITDDLARMYCFCV